ncbi:hypothetical protein V865_004270 [Kwoniella europaea PYCC6329]|uniref:Uncharacterized protein n=1 Tax=Kwoniella europaea PYCC6329 TaxID=1423913 RepID=A0AAX4KII7_9TREE
MDYEEGEIMDCSPISTSTSAFTTHTALTPTSSGEVEDILLVSRGSDNRQPPSKSTQKIYRPPLSLLVPQSSAQGMREGQVSEDNMTRQDLLSPHQPQAYSDHPSTIYPDRIVRRVSNTTSRSSFPLEEVREIFSMPMPMMDRCVMIWELYESRSDIDMEISRIQEAHHKQLSVIQKRFDDRSLKIRDELVNLRQNLETSQSKLQKEAEEHQNTKETKNHLMIRIDGLTEVIRDLKKEKTEENQKNLNVHSDLREQLRMKISHITEMGHQISQLKTDKRMLNAQILGITSSTADNHQLKINELNGKLEEEKKKDKSVLKHLQQIAQLNRDNHLLKREVSKLESSLDQEKARGDRLDKELETSNKSRIDSGKRAEKAILSCEEIRKELYEVKAELCESTKSLERKEKQLADLGVIKDRLVRELIQTQTMANKRLEVEKNNLTQQFQVGINELRSQLERLAVEKGIINSSLIIAQSELRTCQSNLSVREEENKELKMKIRDLNKDIKDKTKREKEWQGKMERLKVLNADVEKLNEEVFNLKGQLIKQIIPPEKTIPLAVRKSTNSGYNSKSISKEDRLTSIGSNSELLLRASSPLSSAPPSPDPTTPRSIPKPYSAKTLAKDCSTIISESACDDHDQRRLVVISRSKLDELRGQLEAAKLENERLKENKKSTTVKDLDGHGVMTPSQESEISSTSTIFRPNRDEYYVTDKWSKEIREEPDWTKRYKMQLRELIGVVEAKRNEVFLNILKRPRQGAEDPSQSDLVDVNKIDRRPQKRRIYL